MGGDRKLRVIRFDPELFDAILKGRKTTTWRRRPKRGRFEIALGGTWFKPNRTGYIIELEPEREIPLIGLLSFYYEDEGFESPADLFDYLSKKYPRGIPEKGWLMRIVRVWPAREARDSAQFEALKISYSKPNG